MENAPEITESRNRFNRVAKALNDQPLFDALSALRGPDNNYCHELKKEVTARIRYALFGEDLPSCKGEYLKNGSFYNGAPFTQESLDKISMLVRRTQDHDELHFVAHLARSVEALRNHMAVHGVTIDQVITTLKYGSTS